MKRTALSIIFALSAIIAMAQTGLKKVYDETINPMTQIDEAVAQAKASNGEKFVICQVGGNWCPWCLRFANFISKDADIMKLINENFIYIHVNYNPRKAKGANQADAAALMQRLNNPQRFGFPVFVVLDEDGKVVHIQDSSFLEEGQGYNKEKVLRFLKAWTPAAVGKNVEASTSTAK
jgi:thioredoxin-related protein